MHRQHADLFSLGVQVVDDFLDRFTHRTHGNDQAFGVRRAMIIEQGIFAAGQFGDFGHIALDDFRQFFPVTIGYFALLEVDVRVLHAAAQRRMIRVERPAAEFVHRTIVQEACQFVIFENFDLLHFVGSPEPIKEVQERHPTLNRRQMGDCRQIHHLLHAAFGQHGEAGLPRRHNVGMIAENADRIGADDPGADMEYARQQFAGDFVHVGNHQK